MEVVAIVGLEIFLQAYFVTIHSLAGESAQCIHKDWRKGTGNRYNPSAHEGMNSILALQSKSNPLSEANEENFDVEKQP